MITPTPSLPPFNRTHRTQDLILGGVRSLLATGGMEAVSMRAVAERSGLTAGAIYKHFKDKQALIDTVVEMAFHNFELSLFKAIASLPVGSFERLAALGESYIRFAEEHQEEFKILFMPLVTARKRFRDLPGQGGYPILRRCVVEAIEAGTLRNEDPDLVSLFLWTRVHGIVMLLLACDLDGAISLGGSGEELISPAMLFRETRNLLIEGLKPNG
ncbi:MAG: TetR/AcrR family transcriptional regulator [Gemmatimonadetes bacterium]|nr:TetR/AcrR family transcriptional regulator [Gemmatimonadota bacterium]